MRVSHFPAAACGILLAIATVSSAHAAGAAEPGKSAKAKKPPSACVGLDESACGGNAACYWRKATHLKSGKTRRAHCRLKTHAAKKTSPT